jgi:hypothetical protein
MEGAAVLTAWRDRAATLTTPGRGGRSTNAKAASAAAIIARFAVCSPSDRGEEKGLLAEVAVLLF